MLTSTPVDRARRRDFRARQSSLASLALRLVPLASRLPSSLLAASRSSPRFPRFAFALLSFVLARRPRASRAVVVFVHAPMIVPCAVVPFLSSIVTLSLESFCKNRTSFMASRRLRERPSFAALRRRRARRRQSLPRRPQRVHVQRPREILQRHVARVRQRYFLALRRALGAFARGARERAQRVRQIRHQLIPRPGRFTREPRLGVRLRDVHQSRIRSRRLARHRGVRARRASRTATRLKIQK